MNTLNLPIFQINEELYAISRDFGQRGTYAEAISGIDVALWDLLGKSLRTPVCRLLGGEFRKRVKVYATGIVNFQCKKYLSNAFFICSTK